MQKANSKSSKKRQGTSRYQATVKANEPSLLVQASSDLQPGGKSLRESESATSCIGFNGQLFDAVSGTYLLGNGYRAYSPTMRAFYSPDSLSPFGGGGVNRYQYCNLDPINNVDPTGHAVLSVAALILTAISVATTVSSIGVSVAAGRYRESQPEYAQELTDIAFALDIVATITGLAGAGTAVAAKVAVKRAAARASVAAARAARSAARAARRTSRASASLSETWGYGVRNIDRTGRVIGRTGGAIEGTAGRAADAARSAMSNFIGEKIALSTRVPVEGGGYYIKANLNYQSGLPALFSWVFTNFPSPAANILAATSAFTFIVSATKASLWPMMRRP